MDEKLSYDALLKEYNSQVEKYNTLIDTSPDGIMLLKSVRNEDGQIVDFQVAHCNRAGTILGHFPPDAQSKTLLTILPHLKNSEQFALHKRVIETGKPVLFETSFRNHKGEEYGWFIVSLMKLEDTVFSRFIDISEKKENENKVEKQAVFYNGILEASINGVYACKAVRNSLGEVDDFIILKVNKAFTEMTKKPAREVEDKSFLSIFPQAKLTGIFDIYCEVLSTGIPIRREMQSVTGLQIWYDISIGKISDDAIVITFNNITERLKAFAEVEEQRNLLNNILKNSPSGIAVSEVVKNEAGEVVDVQVIVVNEITEKFTGITPEQFLGHKVNQLQPAIAASGLYKQINETLQTGKSFRTQLFWEPNGKWLELGVSKMDESRLVNIYTDITESKESQIKLEKLVEELKRSNANLEEFTYAASHDLKEPIRKIRIFSDRIKMQHSAGMDEEGIRILDRLLSASLRMRLLVDDLLEYSQISLFEKEPEIINLNDKLQKVMEDLEIEIEEKKAVINVANLPVIKGQRRQLQQLFQNLVSNSLKYSRKDVTPVINISCKIIKGHDIPQQVTTEEIQKDFYHIEVSDNGIGFEQNNADKIFRIFQRLHARSDYQGTGVGLFIVKKVVEKHQGYITAAGTPGHGAIFNIYLPAH